MISDYYDFFLFVGGLLILGGIIYLFFRRSLQNIFIAEQEAERLISEEEISKLRASNQIATAKISKTIDLQSSLLSKILLAIIIGGFLFNQLLIWRMDSSSILKKLLNISISITRKNDK